MASNDSKDSKVSQKATNISEAKKPPVKKSPAKSGGKVVAARKSSATKEGGHVDFCIDIHEVKTSLAHSVWYIPSDRQFVSMLIVFLDAGMKNVNGTHPAVSSFLDMLMKGCGKLDQYAFLETLYDNGATINFANDVDHAFLSFWAPFASYKVPLSLIPDMCLAPRLPNKWFEKTRIDVLNNFRESLKDPSTHLHEAMNAAFYPDKHPYRASLARMESDIKSIKPQDIRDYMKLLCQGNAVVVVVGPKDNEAEIVENIEKMLSAFPVEGAPVVTKYGPINTPEHDIHVPFDIPQTMIAGRQPGFNTTDPNYYAKRLVFAIVARPSLDSLMYENVRGSHGLAYYCHGKACINSGDASLEYAAGTRNETAEAAKSIMKETCANVAKKGVSKDDFNLAKKEIAGGLVVGLDSSSSKLSFCINNRVLGRTLEETQNQQNLLKNVSFEEVNAAGKDTFDKNIVFVTVGGGAASMGEERSN
jgi:predicted Zn-dependent peptidase